MAANTNTPRCGKCRRPLTSPTSIRRGYGTGCWTKARNTTAAEFKPHQRESAREAIEDQALVLLRDDIHLVVGTNGTAIHRTTPNHCSCPAGVRGARCWHLLAVLMVTNPRPLLHPRVFGLAA
ncbi:DUF6011 domain-containing protein [Nocardiopsis terrae]|uniref:DUF6011 domain-containing protein n=1 Tax=Streptomyces sp. NPDC057554 TaxID=3350538 RepID=UPI00367AA94B